MLLPSWIWLHYSFQCPESGSLRLKNTPAACNGNGARLYKCRHFQDGGNSRTREQIVGILSC